jgi:hypothetical protein
VQVGSSDGLGQVEERMTGEPGTEIPKRYGGILASGARGLMRWVASFWAGSMPAGKKPVKVSLRLAALDL